jgi:hypothetical protein
LFKEKLVEGETRLTKPRHTVKTCTAENRVAFEPNQRLPLPLRVDLVLLASLPPELPRLFLAPRAAELDIVEHSQFEKASALISEI